ncbi:uncharacterized protein N7483_005175 [Penicillium malachiteum]|uniref:uncharacterized protein n=1 Tax=Penicillium malachiteum TaxID=1324776 RepID=UPI0025495C62|nr:uncharacterized protein N7483_005175 [Penicillium malachiteum]KAJ5730667.1 hypothetical protein N7483_005175 [Penicillium malachiteum]
MESALDDESKSSRRYTAKARINALLSYFEEAGENWQMAKWTFRVSEWVIKQAGLRVDEDAIISENSPKSVEPQSNDWNCGDQSTAAFSSIPAPFAPFFTSESLFAFGDAFPDPWLENLFGDIFHR